MMERLFLSIHPLEIGALIANPIIGLETIGLSYQINGQNLKSTLIGETT